MFMANSFELPHSFKLPNLNYLLLHFIFFTSLKLLCALNSYKFLNLPKITAGLRLAQICPSLFSTFLVFNFSSIPHFHFFTILLITSLLFFTYHVMYISTYLSIHLLIQSSRFLLYYFSTFLSYPFQAACCLNIWLCPSVSQFCQLVCKKKILGHFEARYEVEVELWYVDCSHKYKIN